MRELKIQTNDMDVPEHGIKFISEDSFQFSEFLTIALKLIFVVIKDFNREQTDVFIKEFNEKIINYQKK